MSNAFLTGKGFTVSCVEELINPSTAQSIEVTRGPIIPKMPKTNPQINLFTVRCNPRQNRVFFFLPRQVLRTALPPRNFVGIA
jgi:hypothetical protein